MKHPALFKERLLLPFKAIGYFIVGVFTWLATAGLILASIGIGLFLIWLAFVVIKRLWNAA